MLYRVLLIIGLLLLTDVEKAWSTVVADRMKRHFGQKQGVRKRLWGEAFRPLNFDQPSDDITSASETSTILKPVPQQPILRSNNEGSTTNGPNDSSSVNSEASKLTSEVAFWLRHLKPTMARTLTAAATTGSSSSETPVKQEELSPPEVTDNNEVQLTRWPGTDSIMVLYMAHQQGMLSDIAFLVFKTCFIKNHLSWLQNCYWRPNFYVNTARGYIYN